MVGYGAIIFFRSDCNALPVGDFLTMGGSPSRTKWGDGFTGKAGKLSGQGCFLQD
jgi:hypothetical protein